jgi:cobalt-zinc-cadmium efflux system outer membrane protein
MKRRTRHQILVALTLLVSAVAAPAWGQASLAAKYQDPVRGVTIDQLVSMAMQRSKRLAAARAQIDVARGDRQQSATRANPVLDVSHGEQAGGADRRTAIGVVWPLELFRISAREVVGREQESVAGLDVSRAEWEVASRVRQDAGRALTAIRALEVTEQQAGAARSLRDLVAASVIAGALPRLDREIADVEVRRLEAAVRIAQGEVDAAIAVLKGAIGVDQREPIVFRPIEGEVTSVVGETASRLLGSATERPDVALTTAELRLLSAQTGLAKKEGQWDVDFTAGYMRTDMGFPQFGIDSNGQAVPIAARFHELSFGAMVRIPWRNRNQGAVLAAAARESAKAAERDALGLEAAADLAATRARWAAGRDASGQYREGLLTLARQNLDVIQQTYLAGRGTLNDVIAERRRLLDLELSYTSLLAELLAADADLRRALGVIR